MKICYIIKTCDKYLDNRLLYQANSFIKNINIKDIYYLTSKPDISKRHYGWNTNDSYEHLNWKVLNFLYNVYIPNYDWYIFIHDDTFVFTERLNEMLTKYDSKSNYYIGKELEHIQNDFCLYMSGGAGYILSSSLFSLLKKHIIINGLERSFKHWCEDLNTGLLLLEISKNNQIIQINNNNFHVDVHSNELELKTAITFHRVITKEQYEFYNITMNDKYINTVFALITDFNYYDKAKRTILDLRSKGNWSGKIVLITIDFNLNNNFKDFYNITEVKFPLIDKTALLSKIGENGFIDTTDKREINKLHQWEKLHVFDDYFKQWSRVVYLDSGLRVLDDVKYILELNYKNKILAPKDGKLYEEQNFKCQISYYNTELVDSLKSEFGEHILQSNYMLNCMWIYDTDILKLCNKTQLIEAMNKYTFCKTNEMGVMNLLFHFKYRLWETLPIKASNGKILFDWCELNQSYYTTWREYCFIKYPVTINFEDC
jgi:hypothetical protein